MTQAHLTEERLQGAADGSLDAEQMRAVYGHLSECESCAAEVARLRTVMTRAREANTGAPSLDDLWPAIRSRIEESKVVAPKAFAGRASGASARRPWLAIGSTAVAAALLIAAFTQMQRWTPHASEAVSPSRDVAFASAVDSTRFYEDESRRLLNDLEMQKAMMGPSASASLSGDLAIIDRSIAEQKDALARDPHNIALQRLLAAAYREKVDLLRRANNAG
ncbi:MAG: zf-HC2 domain-containing protein [Gemmatimonadaceae bacterium]|nr:zf-HC2 domain-containing protein [Gemmatimonadaceae bacterium]